MSRDTSVHCLPDARYRCSCIQNERFQIWKTDGKRNAMMNLCRIQPSCDVFEGGNRNGWMSGRHHDIVTGLCYGIKKRVSFL